jgi:hypothetical protein
MPTLMRTNAKPKTFGGKMKLKSSPILGTIGLLYGIFTGSVIAHTITKDHYETKDEAKVVVFEVVYPDITIPEKVIEIEQVILEPEIAPEIENKIPSDLTKRCPRWEDKLKANGFPVKLFSYIMWRESRCNPKAHNTTLNRDKSQDLGLLQINSTWKTVTKNICGTSIDGLFDPTCNLKVAKYLYDNGGAGHWSM